LFGDNLEASAFKCCARGNAGLGVKPIKAAAYCHVLDMCKQGAGDTFGLVSGMNLEHIDVAIRLKIGESSDLVVDFSDPCRFSSAA
jgi:hypothetical protein